MTNLMAEMKSPNGKVWYLKPCSTIEQAKDFLRGVSGQHYESNIRRMTITIMENTDA